MIEKKNLAGLSYTTLSEQLAPLQLPSYRIQQIYQWLYVHGCQSFQAMQNIPHKLRCALEEKFNLNHLPIKTAQSSKDGTQKWLLTLADQQEIETVHIPEKNRGTLCVSSQVGCTLTCRFCHTGTQTLVKNLTPAEIIGQVVVARDVFGEWSKPLNYKRAVSHIVFMGMGEPLYNYDNVATAIQTLCDPGGLNFTPRHITLSTSGVVPQMDKMTHELGVNLAISLHAVRNDLRNQIMPLNKKYPLEALMAACHRYKEVVGRMITFEYVMLKDVNDTEADAKGLIQLIQGLPAKINLIPFNPWPGSPYQRSSEVRIRQFAKILMRAGYASPIRRPRGQDILAACGQLKSESQRQSKSRRKESTPL